MNGNDTDQGAGSDQIDASADDTSRSRAVRAVVALVGVGVGLVWTARIAVDGSVSSGVLFKLLPPLALVYLGLRYFRRVMGSSRLNGP